MRIEKQIRLDTTEPFKECLILCYRLGLHLNSSVSVMALFL